MSLADLAIYKDWEYCKRKICIIKPKNITKHSYTWQNYSYYFLPIQAIQVPSKPYKDKERLQMHNTSTIEPSAKFYDTKCFPETC